MLSFINKLSSYLGAGINAAVTVVPLQTGQGVLWTSFYSPVAGAMFRAKIEEPSTGAYEIVTVISISGDNLGVIRGQDGTGAQSFTASAFISLVASADVFKTLMRRRNRLINGCFRLWNYGVNFVNPADGTFVANRWKVHFAGGGAGSQTISRLNSTPGEYEQDYAPFYWLRWAQTVASAGGETLELEQRIEDVRQGAAKPFTVSFLAKSFGGAVTVGAYLQQVFGTGGAPSATVTLATQTVAIQGGGAVARYQMTFQPASLAGKTLGTTSPEDNYLRAVLVLPAGVTFDVAFATVQGESAPVASDFEFRMESEEWRLAQRYYYSTYDNGSAPGTLGIPGAVVYFATLAGVQPSGVQLRLPVQMRKIGAVAFFNPSVANGNWRNASAGADSALAVLNGGSSRNIQITNAQVGGDAVGNVINVHVTADSEL